MSKRSWWISAVVAVLGVALLAWAFAPRPTRVEVAEVVEGAFEATVDEDGHTRVRERYVVAAPLAGTLARVTLREGDPVQAGEVVARLAPLSPALNDRRTVLAQRAAVAAAEAGLERADAGVARTAVALSQARSELHRTERLARERLVAAAKLDTDRLALRAAQSDAGAAVAERHMAEHELEQARAALATVLGDGEDGPGFELRSPVAGRVLRVLQQSEGSVAIGTPVLEIGDTAGLEIVAELLTTEAVRVRPGQRVHIERWGGEGRLEGRVRRVEPGAFTKVSALGVEEQRVRVLVDLLSPPEQWIALGDGFRVSVQIVVDAAEQAVLVPLGALFPHPGGGMGVFVFDDGRARLVDVAVRARGSEQAWLGSGLAAGDRIIVYPPTELVDGARVRQRDVR